MVDFLFVIRETRRAEICQNRHFLKGWVTLRAHFRWECRPPTAVGVRKLKCTSLQGFKQFMSVVQVKRTEVFAVCSFISSQSTCVTDEQMDGWRELRLALLHRVVKTLLQQKCINQTL